MKSQIGGNGDSPEICIEVCGQTACRKEFWCFASDLDVLAKQYKGFISAWLVKKYKLGLKWGASRY